MTKQLQAIRPVIRECDADGHPIARVYLHGSPNRRAVVDEDAYDDVLALGYSERWYLNAFTLDGIRYGYVRVYQPGIRKLRNVAQLILLPGRGTGISYRDGDPLNLRRSNLMIKAGRSKGDQLTPDPFAGFGPIQTASTPTAHQASNPHNANAENLCQAI